MTAGHKDGARREAFTIEVAGKRLGCAWIGGKPERGQSVLVFLHEGLGCMAFWKDFPERLCAATGLGGLLYDRWGYGASDPFDAPRRIDYLETEARLFLSGLLERLGIDRPVLIGHSDGGSIALLFGAFFPKRPAAIVSEAAHIFVEEVTLAGIRDAVLLWETGDLARRLERHHGPGTRAVFEGWAGTWLSPAFRDWSIEAHLPAIEAPLLVIQGEDDDYGTPAQVDAIAQAVSGPVRTLMLPACAHVPHLQATEPVLEAMSGFIRQTLAEAR